MHLPELLSPGGDLEKLETALDYGADAVYVGGERFGLRAAAGNFTLEELARARDLTGRRGKRLYLTLNTFLHPEDLGPFADYLEKLRPLALDAYIITDPGALYLARRIDPQRSLHLSTQANTTNPLSVQFWAEAGVSRINLARELTLAELRTVRAATDLEIEVFVHGAMCVAYSGRCLLSAAMTGRSANQGACTQPCRWKYAMVEETRPGEYFPIEEDHRGTYILNSRDLCMIDAMPHLLAAGVDSLKIEGRMKSRYYVAAVTRVYRAALDRYLAAPAAFRPDPSWREELEKVSHRPYDQGFLFGGRDPLIHQGDSKYRRFHEFVGVVLDMDESGFGLVEGRNRFFPGETLEILGPQMRQATFQAGELRAEDDSVLTAAQPNLRVIMALPEGTRRGDMLRREKKTK